MTNVTVAEARRLITEALATAANTRVKDDLTAALGRKKSLEDKNVEKEAELQALKDEIKILKSNGTERGNEPAEVNWADLVKNVEAKNVISNIVSVEAKHVKQKENNLVIMERRDNNPKVLIDGMDDEVVKGEKEKVLAAISKSELKDKVKATRFKSDGPVLLICDDLATKRETLVVAN